MIARRLPSEFVLSSIVLLLVGDGILVGLWYYSLFDSVEVLKHFRLGIAGAFATSSMGRAIYFMLSYNEKM